MADQEQTGRRIQVANARPEDAGRGLARLPLAVMAQLQLSEGDVIEIVNLERWWQTFPLFLSCILVLVNTLLDTAKALRGDPEPRSAHSLGSI